LSDLPVEPGTALLNVPGKTTFNLVARELAVRKAPE